MSLNIYIKKKMRQAFFFFIVVTGMPLLFIVLFGYAHTPGMEIATVAFAQGTTTTTQQTETYPTYTNTGEPLSGESGGFFDTIKNIFGGAGNFIKDLFGFGGSTEPTFTGSGEHGDTPGSIGQSTVGSGEADYSFQRFLESRGAERIISGSEGFVPTPNTTYGEGGIPTDSISTQRQQGPTVESQVNDPYSLYPGEADFPAGSTERGSFPGGGNDPYSLYPGEADFPAGDTKTTAQSEVNDPFSLYPGEADFPDTAASALQDENIDLYGGIFEDSSAGWNPPMDFSRDLDSGDFGDIEAPALENYYGDFADTISSDAAQTLSGGVQNSVDRIFTDIGLGNPGVIGGAIERILGGGGLPGGVGGAVGAVTGLFGGGGGSFVPVKDFTQIALQERLVTKEYALDPVASLAAKSTIRGVLGNVTNFINRGDNGNPYYVTNSTLHFQQLGNQSIGKFLAEANTLGLHPVVQRSLARNAAPTFAQTIRPTVTVAERNAFLQNFSNGGWNMWLRMLQPQNNILGQYALAENEMTRRVQEAEIRREQELAWGRGYKSAKVCLARDKFGNCTYEEIVTPGSFIENQQAAVFASILRQLELDDELSEITSSFLSNMLSQIFGGRQTGLRGFSSLSLAPLQTTDVEAFNRSKSGLNDSLRALFADEAEYLSKKSASLVRLNQAKESLETLLPARVYNFEEPLKSRVTGSAELASAVSSNQSYATTTVNQVVIPGMKLLANDITLSTQLLDQIQTLGTELARATTPAHLVTVSNKYLELAKKTHGKPALEKVNEESKILDDFAASTIADVASRFAQEGAIISKIQTELSSSS